MILYMINTTFVWVVCLVFFDFFLRKETFHKANRVYLISTLFIGLILPLISFTTEVVRNTPAEQPSYGINRIKETIVQTISTNPATHALKIEMILWLLYSTGVAISIVFVMKEVALIMKLYKKGNKIESDSYLLIETGEKHSPISFGKKIFITASETYTDQELQMILTHELNHHRLYHVVDKIVFTILRILLWFHPLIHIYSKRLQMVHEYEADDFSKNEAKQYGSFLIEQTLLQSHSIIAHSFNYSPIKNRIAMLTKNNSPRVRLFKYVVLIPMLFIFLVCCTQQIKSHDMNKERKVEGNIIAFNGNRFEFNEPKKDSILVEDPQTGKIETLLISVNPVPIKMNNEEIYYNNKLSAEARPNTQEGSISVFIFQSLKKELEKLPNGQYFVQLNNLVIDKKGKLVYYDKVEQSLGKEEYHFTNKADEMPFAKPVSKDKLAANMDKKNTLTPALKKETEQKIVEVLEKINFIPGNIDGKNVISGLNTEMDFTVKNHVASLK